MKKILKLLLLFIFILILSSCKKYYTCHCEDNNGNPIEEKGWYQSGSGDETQYLIITEASLNADEEFSNCNCIWD